MIVTDPAAFRDRFDEGLRTGPAGDHTVFDQHGLSHTAVKARALRGRGAR